MMDYKLLIDTAVLAGKIMLESGAEIYRVEDTIQRILEVSECKTTEAYVTATGMIVTLDDPAMDSLTVVKRITTRDTNLNRISIVNDISRQFCSKQISLKTAFHDLKHVEVHQYSWLQRDLATVGVSAAFALLLGGGFQDAFGAAVAAVCLTCLQHINRRIGLNAFMELLLGSTFICVAAMILEKIPGWNIHMDMVIIGSIMPIVPGAALTTAIRDTLQGDYVSGIAKMMEAFVKAAAIVAGVGFGMLVLGGVL